MKFGLDDPVLQFFSLKKLDFVSIAKLRGGKALQQMIIADRPTAARKVYNW